MTTRTPTPAAAPNAVAAAAKKVVQQAAAAPVASAQATAPVASTTAKTADDKQKKPAAANSKPEVKTAAAKPAKTTKQAKAKKPAAAPKATASAETKPVKAEKEAKPVKEVVKEVKEPKAKKPKLVRDSFTIPKDEYEAIDALKLRGAKLDHHAKKSELLRAGLKLLGTLNDQDLLKALQAVPAIKTGRPSGKA